MDADGEGVRGNASPVLLARRVMAPAAVGTTVATPFGPVGPAAHAAAEHRSRLRQVRERHSLPGEPLSPARMRRIDV